MKAVLLPSLCLAIVLQGCMQETFAPVDEGRLLEGEAAIDGEGGYSFSLGKATQSGSGDISFIDYGSVLRMSGTGAGIADLGAIDYNSLTSVPTRSGYRQSVPALVGHVYALRLGGGPTPIFGKLLVQEAEKQGEGRWGISLIAPPIHEDGAPGHIRFQYTIQQSGSTNEDRTRTASDHRSQFRGGESKGTNPFFGWLNSPWAIAIIGGAIATALGGLLIWKLTRRDDY